MAASCLPATSRPPEIFSQILAVIGQPWDCSFSLAPHAPCHYQGSSAGSCLRVGLAIAKLLLWRLPLWPLAIHGAECLKSTGHLAPCLNLQPQMVAAVAALGPGGQVKKKYCSILIKFGCQLASETLAKQWGAEPGEHGAPDKLIFFARSQRRRGSIDKPVPGETEKSKCVRYWPCWGAYFVFL